MRLFDIDWENARLQVVGKGRREVRLPLPQEVGDAEHRNFNPGLPLEAPNSTAEVGRSKAPS
jgi:hypothetical protein